MSILRAGFFVFLTRVWGALVGIIVSIIIARVFGAEGKGIYSLLLLIPSLLVTFGNAGLQISNVYFYGRKLGNIRDLATNSCWAAFVFGLLIFGIFAAIYPFIAKTFLADVPQFYIFSVVALVPLMLINSYFGNLLLAIKKVKQFNLATTLQLTTQLLAIVFLILVFKVGFISIVFATIINVFVGAFLLIYYFRRVQKFNAKINWSLFKHTLKYGLKGYLANVIQFLNYRLDLLLVSYFLGTVAVGWYSVSVNFAEVLWYVPTSLGTILFPHVANTTDLKANIVTARLSRQTLLLMVLASGIVALVCPWLIPTLFGIEFNPAVNSLLIILPGVLIFSLAKILGNDFSGRGKVITNSIVSGVALLTNLTLNLILIPRMGINGAALSSTISYSLATIILIGLFARQAKTHWTRLLIPEQGDVGDMFKAIKFWRK